ncbi:MAG: hypothetical protein SF053_21805 [Bacteroidia bacterium]|nr:hypothetical protein [Bacteroidia bacterium]
MEHIPPQQDASAMRSKGSTLQGDTVKAIEHKIQFRIPSNWVKWYSENTDYPNLHLSPDELALIKDADGEWDTEFSIIVNEILPFDQCIAHVGSEGWGLKGISYADLQVRFFVLTGSSEDLVRAACAKGPEVITGFTRVTPVVKQEKREGWQSVLLEYARRYQDYGAKASVDIRIRPWGIHTIAFAFMYTDHTNHQNEIELILNSVLPE